MIFEITGHRVKISHFCEARKSACRSLVKVKIFTFRDQAAASTFFALRHVARAKSVKFSHDVLRFLRAKILKFSYTCAAENLKIFRARVRAKKSTPQRCRL